MNSTAVMAGPDSVIHAMTFKVARVFETTHLDASKMEFSPAFALLQKFTAGLPEASTISDITQEDVSQAAMYLGIELPFASLDDQKRIVQKELLNQNKFLTSNLHKPDVDQHEVYSRSLFVREIVLNNRKPTT